MPAHRSRRQRAARPPLGRVIRRGVLCAAAVALFPLGGFFIANAILARTAPAISATAIISALSSGCGQAGAGQGDGCGPAGPAATTAWATGPGSPASTRPAGPGMPSPQPTPATTHRASLPGKAVIRRVLRLVNRVRAGARLPRYTLLAGLDRSAAQHDARMAAGCGLSHQCPGEPALGARESAAGVPWTVAGENIGEGGPAGPSWTAITSLALTLTRDMLNERPPADGHRRNLLSSQFHHIGIAVRRDSVGTVWVTEDFAN